MESAVLEICGSPPGASTECTPHAVRSVILLLGIQRGRWSV